MKVNQEHDTQILKQWNSYLEYNQAPDQSKYSYLKFISSFLYKVTAEKLFQKVEFDGDLFQSERYVSNKKIFRLSYTLEMKIHAEQTNAKSRGI